MVTHDCEIPPRPHLGAADFMSRIWENPDGSFMVGAVQPGMVEGEEPPGITRTRVNVILEKSKPEAEPSPFLCSRDFELAQANCPWVTAIHAFVKSKGREVPTNKSWAPCANGLKPTRTISRPIKGFLFRCTHCATGKGKLTRQINTLLVPARL